MILARGFPVSARGGAVCLPEKMRVKSISEAIRAIDADFFRRVSLAIVPGSDGIEVNHS
jgi:hypothetical protein